MENLHVKFEEKTEQLIIREGKALELRDITPIKFKGTIAALLDYYKIRKKTIRGDSSHVEYSHEKSIIKLVVNDKDYFKDEIIGELELEKEYLNLGINSETLNTPEALAKYLRLKLHLFEDKEEGLAVVNALRNFKANVSANQEIGKDDRGNRKAHLDKIVTADGFPEVIKMNMSIFKGYPKTSFHVEIGIDATDVSTKVYLYSVELPGLIHDIIQKEIDAAIATFEDLPLMEY